MDFNNRYIKNHPPSPIIRNLMKEIQMTVFRATRAIAAALPGNKL